MTAHSNEFYSCQSIHSVLVRGVSSLVFLFLFASSVSPGGRRGAGGERRVNVDIVAQCISVYQRLAISVVCNVRYANQYISLGR